MHPDTIKKREDEFFTNLTNSGGVKYTKTATTDIGSGIKIYSIRPNFDSYYYNTKTVKKSICLHFTVGYIKSDTTALSTKDNHVSVSYVVDRTGRIYEMFPDTDWSYHLGSGAVGGNGVMSKQSIGIEISNYGPLKLSGENLVDAYGNTYCSVSETKFYTKQNYRGYDYFASMTDDQINAVVQLLQYLGRKHNIPMNFKPDDAPFNSASEATSFNGVFYHTNVRKDKFDWPFSDSIKAIIAKCSDVTPKVEEQPKDATNVEVANVQEAPAKVEEPIAPTPEVQPPQPEPQKVEEPSVPETPTKVETASVQKAQAKVEEQPKAASSKSTASTTKKAASIFEIIISIIVQLFGSKKK